MDYYSMSDQALAKELGWRIKSRRLKLNRTQGEVATRSGLSVTAVKNIEAGKGRISSLLAVLRELNSLDGLDSFVQPETVSPLQFIKVKGKGRLRASSAGESSISGFKATDTGHYVIRDGKIISKKEDDSEW